MPISLLALLLIAPGAGEPAVYFEQTLVTLVDGQPRGEGVVSQVWHAGRRMRLEAGNTPGGPAFVLRLDTGKAYRLDPATKTAVAVDVERLRARSQMDLAVAGDLMGGDENVRAVPLKTLKTVAGHVCQGYRISSGTTVLEVYVTRELPLGMEAFAEFLVWSGAEQALGGILGELRRLPGFPLETRARVEVGGRVHQTLSSVTKVKVAPLPESLFDPPPDYRVVAEEPDPEEER